MRNSILNFHNNVFTDWQRLALNLSNYFLIKRKTQPALCAGILLQSQNSNGRDRKIASCLRTIY